MKMLAKKFIMSVFVCLLAVGTLPVINIQASTLEENVSKTVAFGEYNGISFVKGKPTILKIVLKDKGSFNLDFSPSSVYSLVAKLYDENNNLICSSPFYGIHQKEVNPLFMGYKSNLEAGTYYLWMSSDKDATYSYFARQIPSKDVSVEMCINVKKGKTVQLDTIFQNTKNTKVKWSSSNKKVASVNSQGKVKGIKKGTAIIKAYNSSGLVTKIKVKVTN